MRPSLAALAALTAALAALTGCSDQGTARYDRAPPTPESAENDPASTVAQETTMTDHVEKTEEEWRAQLTGEQYRIAREKGTERAFTGEYWDSKTKGVYRCVCCGAELFSSDTKFDSGTGWPSFYEPIGDASVKEETDRTFGMTRTEVMCRRCDAHLGHVFDDGPAPTGQRYCINSASLRLEPTPGG